MIGSTNEDTVEKNAYQCFSTNDARIGVFSLSGTSSTFGLTYQDTVEKSAHQGFSF